jgi:hypothetical protein
VSALQVMCVAESECGATGQLTLPGISVGPTDGPLPAPWPMVPRGEPGAHWAPWLAAAAHREHLQRAFRTYSASPSQWSLSWLCRRAEVYMYANLQLGR